MVARTRSFRVRPSRSERVAVSRSSAIGTEDKKVGVKALETLTGGCWWVAPSSCSSFRSASMLACVLHSVLPVWRTDDVAGPSGSAQHHAVLVVCCDPGAMLEQMWHKTGVPPSALADCGEVRLLVGPGA
jgi:hypothetical protein